MNLTVQPNYYFKRTNLKNNNYSTNGFKPQQQVTFKGFDYNQRVKDKLKGHSKFDIWWNDLDTQAKQETLQELVGYNMNQEELQREKDRTIAAKEEALAAKDREIQALKDAEKAQREKLAEAEKNHATKEELNKIKEEMDQLKAQKVQHQQAYDTELENLKRAKDAQKDYTARKAGQGWAKVAGNERTKKLLEENFIQKLALEQGNAEVNMPNGVLFYGPRSTGKTLFARAFAEQAKCNYVEINMLKSDNEKILTDLLQAAEDSKKIYEDNNKKRTIILLDEFDAIANIPENQNIDRINKNKEIVANLRSFLSDCAEKYKCTVFMTTNYPKDIDAELLSPKRVPRAMQIYLGPPEKEDVTEIFKFYLKNATDQPIDHSKLADEVMKVKPSGRAFSVGLIEDMVADCINEALTAKQKLTESNIIDKITKVGPDIDKKTLSRFIENVAGYAKKL